MVTSGHSVDYLKTDMLSLMLILLSSYGLVHIFDLLIKIMGVTTTHGGVKLGLTVGTFAIGLPLVTMLNLLGFGKIVLLVVFSHSVLLSILIGLTIIKLKKL